MNLKQRTILIGILLGGVSIYFFSSLTSNKPYQKEVNPLPTTKSSQASFSHPSTKALKQLSTPREPLREFIQTLEASNTAEEISLPFTKTKTNLQVLENTFTKGRRTVRLQGKHFSGSLDYRYEGTSVTLQGYFLNNSNPEFSYTIEGTSLNPIINKAREEEIICVGIPRLKEEEPLSSAPENLKPSAAPALINSKPDAPAVIYLDFDGETVNPDNNNATPWNGGNEIVVGPSTQSDANIEQICREVAEDFSPWNITVTNDLSVYEAVIPQQRIRVIITPDSDWYGSAGGVAYLYSFDNTTDNPCWVFNTGRNGIMEATSHEVGHTLGLSHDGRTTPSETYYGGHGSGTTGWAPIMGVGYYQNLAQWSKGEYNNANNTEDDVTQIENHLIGAESPANPLSGYRTDLAGDNLGGSALLTVSGGTTVSQSGIIETALDKDLYIFTTGAGNISFNFNVNPDEPNLDIQARLLDSGGNVIATNNPESDINASISETVSAGAYFLEVDGIGKGDVLGTGYSDYGSIGQFTITGTIIDSGGLTPPPVAFISSITDPLLLATDHNFQVTYQVPNGGASTNILSSSVAASNISVEDPSGTPLTVTLTSTSPSGTDASPITATYSVSAPGGTWNATNAGIYTIKMNAKEVEDDLGVFITAANLGTFSVEGDPPEATFTDSSPTITDLSYKEFSVTYTDASAVLYSTLGNGDLSVTGPNGYSEIATLQNASPASNSSSITATYRVPAPSAAWQLSDQGTYQVNLIANEISDIGNAFAPASNIGSFTIEGNAPIASLDPTKPITVGTGAKQFTITYTDETSILASSLSTGDITVSGPNGYSETASFLSASPNTNNPSITATYEIPAPTGTWTLLDQGSYTISTVGGEVSDIVGSVITGMTIGSIDLIGTFWTENMDSDPGFTVEGDWEWGTPGGSPNPSSGNTGSSVLGTNLSGDYSNNISPISYATSPSLSTLGYSNIYFSFDRWLGIENQQWDKAYIDYSIDDGVSWTPLWESSNTSSFEESSWSNYCYALENADNITTLKVRFGIESDGSVTFCGWNLDDLALSGISLGNQAPIVTLDSPVLSSGNKVNIPSEVGLVIETSALDDTLSPSSLTYTWSQSGGTGTATFSDLNSPDPYVTFSTDDQYELTLNVSDGDLSTDLIFNVHTGVTLTPPSSPSTDGGIVHLSLDETSGTTATDSFNSDESNNGTSVGSPTLGQLGIRGNAYQFDGTDDRINIADSADINTNSYQERTVALWFKPDNLTGREVLFEEGGRTRGLNIYLDNDSLYVGGWNNGDNGWSETWLNTQITDTNWQHVALVLDAPDNASSPTGFKLYFNGQLISQGNGGELLSHTDDTGIGARNGATTMHDGDPTTDHHYAGLIDDFLLYNRALPAEEIAALTGENIGPNITFTTPVTTSDSPLTVSKTISDDGFGGTLLSDSGWSQITTTSGDTVTINGDEITFPSAGTYDLRIIANDTLIKTFRDLSLTYELKTPYELWIESYTSYSEPAIDFDNDGVPNLIEFASGGDPTQKANSSPTQETSRGSDGIGNFILVTIHQRKSANSDGLTYILQYNTDLLEPSWNSQNISLSGTPLSIDSIYEAVTYRIDYGTSPLPDEFFTRYGVTINE